MLSANQRGENTLLNIQNSDKLITNDRFRTSREINNSNNNLNSRDSTLVQEIRNFFEQIQNESNIENICQLVNEIYKLSLSIVLKPKMLAYFSDHFPFEVFLKVAATSELVDVQSYAFVCLATACHEKSFPANIFETPEILSFFISALCSEDPTIVDSALQILTAVVKASNQSREFLLLNGIVDKIISMKLTFSVAELLDSICKNPPPPDPIYIPRIAEFIATIIDGSETQIFELGLNSLLSLLVNNASGIVADDFQQFLMPIIVSEIPPLVQLALKILMFVNQPNSDFAITFLKILESNDLSSIANNPSILNLIAQLFAHFQPIWKPVIQNPLFTLLESKIGITKYLVDVQIMKTLILYYDLSNSNNLEFFQRLVRFSLSPEIGSMCMKQILIVIQAICDPQLHQRMIEILGDSLDTFRSIAENDDDDTAVLAEAILENIENS